LAKYQSLSAKKVKHIKKAMLLGSRRLRDGDEAIKVMKWTKPNFKKAFGVELGSKTYSPQEFVKKFPKYAKYSAQNMKMMKGIQSKARGLPTKSWIDKLLPF
jgi:hypothetical protein